MPALIQAQSFVKHENWKGSQNGLKSSDSQRETKYINPTIGEILEIPRPHNNINPRTVTGHPFHVSLKPLVLLDDPEYQQKAFDSLGRHHR